MFIIIIFLKLIFNYVLVERHKFKHSNKPALIRTPMLTNQDCSPRLQWLAALTAFRVQSLCLRTTYTRISERLSDDPFTVVRRVLGKGKTKYIVIQINGSSASFSECLKRLKAKQRRITTVCQQNSSGKDGK